MSCANIINNLVEKYSQNCFITNGKNIINYSDNKAFSSKNSKKIMRIEIDLPTTYDKDKYAGRVYMIDLEFNIFLAKIGINYEEDSNIEDSRITKFNQQFIFDTTWKYPIEPYNPNSLTITKTIPDLFCLKYKEILDEINNKLIYDFYLDEKRYIVVDNFLRLTSVYPQQQNVDNLKIIYSLLPQL